jgi:hypothetical protein
MNPLNHCFLHLNGLGTDPKTLTELLGDKFTAYTKQNGKTGWFLNQPDTKANIENMLTVSKKCIRWDLFIFITQVQPNQVFYVDNDILHTAFPFKFAHNLMLRANFLGLNA